MSWELDSKRSIYGQVMERILRRIVTGHYPPGGRIESVRELADEAGVNPNTMQRALSEMERDGIIFSNRTSGRFVTEDVEKIEAVKNQLAKDAAKNFIASMRDLELSESEMLKILKDTLKEDS